MNSTMMPNEGKYICKKTTPEIAKEVVSKADKIESFVGYPDTAKYMKRVLGIDVVLSRAQTVFEAGDIAIVCKLRYRLQNPAQKGVYTPQDEDFEWWLVEYQPQGGRDMKMKKRKYKVNIEKLADFFKDKYRYEIAEIFGVAPPTITKLFKNPVCSLKLARKIAQLVPEAVQPIEEEEK
jgi:hypothetical protein